MQSEQSLTDKIAYDAPFDNQIGLVFTELTPDGATAYLEVQPKLLQPMGIVHGGVYCSIIESIASTSASERGACGA